MNASLFDHPIFSECKKRGCDLGIQQVLTFFGDTVSHEGSMFSVPTTVDPFWINDKFIDWLERTHRAAVPA